MIEHASGEHRGPADTGDTVVILRRSGTYDGDAQYERIVDAAREAITNAGGEDEDEAAANAVLEALRTDATPANSADHASTYRPVFEIHDERARQDHVWGQQNHPDTHPADRGSFAALADDWKRTNAHRDEYGVVTWDGILLEEVYEALAETNPARIRAELLQAAAVAAAWMQAIDRRACDGSDRCPSAEHYEGCFVDWIADGADGAQEASDA